MGKSGNGEEGERRKAEGENRESGKLGKRKTWRAKKNGGKEKEETGGGSLPKT